MFYRINNTFPTGSDIVKGIHIDSDGRIDPDPNDFILSISTVLDPGNKKKLNIDIVKVDKYYYTKPFKIYFTNDYILHWDNDISDIHIQQTFTVSDRISETNHTKGRLKG